MHLKRLEIPGYLVAGILILFPIADGLLSVLPFRVGEVTWRFGALGLISRSMMTPLLGAYVALIVAILADRRSAARALAVLSGVFGLAVLVILPIFVSDVIEMRLQIQPEAMLGFNTAAGAAVAKYFIGAGTSFVFAVAGWRAAGRDKRSDGKDAKAMLVSAP